MKKNGERIFSTLLAVALLMGMLLAAAPQAEAASDPAAFIFDISEGPITIGAGTAANTLKVTYGASLVEDNIPDTQEITLTGSSSANNYIRVDAPAAVVLDNLHVAINSGPISVLTVAASPVSIRLVGDSALIGGDVWNQHGLALPGGHTVTITGNGSLYAEGKHGIDIGSGSHLTITDEAQVTAVGISNLAGSAGIGTGMLSDTCSLTISGNAVVEARGNTNSAGIGGASFCDGISVTIQDNAKVTATGGSNGIGSGSGSANGGTTTIKDNAQVWATGNATFQDGGGNTLYLLKVEVTDSANAPIQDALVENGSQRATTNAAGLAYLYIQGGAAVNLAISKTSYDTHSEAAFAKAAGDENRNITLNLSPPVTPTPTPTATPTSTPTATPTATPTPTPTATPTPTPSATASGGGGSSSPSSPAAYAFSQMPSSGNDYTAICDGSYSKLTGVYVDGNLLGSGQYSAWEGSTYVKLNASYISTLSGGTHSLTLAFTDGDASGSFTVEGNSSLLGVFALPYGESGGAHTPSATPKLSSILGEAVAEGTEEEPIGEEGDESSPAAPATGDNTANGLPLAAAGVAFLLAGVFFAKRRRMT